MSIWRWRVIVLTGVDGALPEQPEQQQDHPAKMDFYTAFL
jgi:hypothetical protein